MSIKKIVITTASTVVIAISCSAQKHQLTGNIIQVFPSKGTGVDRMSGVKIEYGRIVTKRLILTGAIGFQRYNDFPKFTNGIFTSTSNPELDQYILSDVKTVGPLWCKINEQIYLVGAEYKMLGGFKHNISLKLESGLTVQDSFDYGLDSAKMLIYEDGSTQIVEYTDFFAHRSANTLVILPGLSYQYQLTSNWLLKGTVSYQLPLIRDKYFFSRGGSGFDEYLKIGLGIGFRL